MGTVVSDVHYELRPTEVSFSWSQDVGSQNPWLDGGFDDRTQ
jgi:hypothetical protein